MTNPLWVLGDITRAASLTNMSARECELRHTRKNFFTKIASAIVSRWSPGSALLFRW